MPRSTPPTLPPSPRSAHRVGAAALTALVALVPACRFPATAVHVVLDTDTPPERAMRLRVELEDGDGDGGARVQLWTRGGDVPDAIELPGSFAVAPGRARRDAVVTLAITADIAAAGPDAPALSFRRRARFAFTERTTTRVAIFLPISCGLPSTGCTTVPQAQCTASIRCEERNTTCGDDATCVPLEVQPVPVPPDASIPRPDGAARDGAATDTRADAPALDAPALDAPRSDAPSGDAPGGYGLASGMNTTTPQRGGLGTTGPDVTCAATSTGAIGNVLIGADLYYTAWVEGARMQCAAVYPDGRVEPGATAASVGDTTGTMNTAVCAAGSVAVGIHGTQSGGYVTSLGFLCAPFTQWATGAMGVAMVPAGGAPSGTTFRDECPARAVMTAARFALFSGTTASVQAVCTPVTMR